MYNNRHDWAEIRRRVLVEGLSKRAACRAFDLDWSTLEKILACTGRLAPASKPSSAPSWTRSIQILEADRTAPLKQQHTAVRIFHRLRGEFGYRGGLSIVSDAVRAWRQRHTEVFVPIEDGLEEAHADFGRAELVLAGRPVKAGTDREIRASFDRESEATWVGRFRPKVTGAYIHAARHAVKSEG